MNTTKYTWDELNAFCLILASRLGSEKFDSVVGVSRGGLIPATIIAEQMGVRELRTTGVRSYQLRRGSKETRPVLYQSCTPYLHGRVLLVDDIADTGETFEYLMKHFNKNKAITEVITCSVFVRRTSSFIPNYYHTDIVGKDWVVFPWEKTPIS
jgi:hypoxanthine phosphoribosyltransferase